MTLNEDHDGTIDRTIRLEGTQHRTSVHTNDYRHEQDIGEIERGT